MKSKGNARLFSNFVWRTDGRGAGGRRGQTCQTEIYFMIVHFYCFKCFRIVLKSKGNARLFSNLVWERKGSQFWKFSLADIKRKYVLECLFLLFEMLSNNIEKHRKRWPFFKFCYVLNVPLRANLASLQGRRQSLNSFLPQRRVRPKDPVRYDTIRLVLFTFLTKQALCRHRISTLTQSDMGRQGGA